MMMFPSDLSDVYDQYGFNRDELLEFLAGFGVGAQNETSRNSAIIKIEAAPEWANSCKAIKRFTLGQAASVLTGLDPMDERWPGDDGQRELERAYTALSQAADDGDLLPVGKDANDRPLFRAQDLSAWAASVGLQWCIPSHVQAAAVMPAGATDEATRQRLRQLEDERARLVEQVAELHRQLQEATAAPQQAPQEAGPAPQQATAAPQDDDKDPLHPKRETTYLNIIGALVELIQSPRDGRDGEAAVIREIVDNYGDRPGISKRNLEGVFPLAKKRLQSD